MELDRQARSEENPPPSGAIDAAAPSSAEGAEANPDKEAAAHTEVSPCMLTMM